jgi:hypothetical protein
VIAERAMYYNNRTCAHDSIGVTESSRTWYLAEGSTSGGFETYLLLANPSDETATVNLTFMTGDEDISTDPVVLPPGRRHTVDVGKTVSNIQVSTRVTSDVPVIAERAMYGQSR